MSDLSPRAFALVTAHEEWIDRYSATVDIIGEGLLHVIACTSLDDQAIDEAMAARPATVTRGWTRSADATFADGLPNPCPCEQRPDTHRHVLYEA